MPLGITRIRQVKLPVTSLATSVAWYRQLLDLEPVFEFYEEGAVRGVVTHHLLRKGFIRMRLPSIFATAVAGVIAVSPAASALPFGSGSAAPGVPAGSTVVIGDYCGSTTAPSVITAQTADGRTAYCVQVSHTDAYVWSLTPDALPADPHSRVSPGDPCLDEGARWTDLDGQPVVCEKTQNGRLAGNLVWMFAV